MTAGNNRISEGAPLSSHSHQFAPSYSGSNAGSNQFAPSYSGSNAAQSISGSCIFVPSSSVSHQAAAAISGVTGDRDVPGDTASLPTSLDKINALPALAIRPLLKKEDVVLDKLLENLRNDLSDQLSRIDKKIDVLSESMDGCKELNGIQSGLNSTTSGVPFYPPNSIMRRRTLSQGVSNRATTRSVRSLNSKLSISLSADKPEEIPPPTTSYPVEMYGSKGSVEPKDDPANDGGMKSDRSPPQWSRVSIMSTSERISAAQYPEHFDSKDSKESPCPSPNESPNSSPAKIVPRSKFSVVSSRVSRLSRLSRMSELFHKYIQNRSSGTPSSDRMSIPETVRNMERIRVTIATHRSHAAVRRQTWAAKIWRFTENPFSSTAAYFYSVFVPLFVGTGVLISFIQTVDEWGIEGTGAELVQFTFEFMFASEWIVRFSCCPDRGEFMTNIFNYIDLMSAAPLFLRITGYVLQWTGTGKLSDDIVRVMTVVPLLRLLRLTRRFETFQLLLSAFKVALEALPVLLYILLLIALIFSALIYFVEPESNISSLPVALWLTIVTMTTVGYGDITPESVAGHIVVSVLIIISALYMAIPIGIVGNAFSTVWGDRDRLLLIQRMRETFLEDGFNLEAVKDIFELFDSDSSGELDIEEFSLMLRTMQINISDERLIALFHALDLNGTGQIRQETFVNNLFPRSYVSSFIEKTLSVTV